MIMETTTHQPTRAEHLQWCKDRALEYIRAGDVRQGLTSMLSDMRKHPETQDHGALQLQVMLQFSGHLNSQEEAEKFINGYN